MSNDYKNTNASRESSTEITENSYHAYLNEILQYKLLSRDEEISLFQKIQNGDDVAKDLFIKSNLRLVIKVAKRYYHPGYNQLLDLIQDGNIGLLQAVNLYDPSRGCKFSTYAVYLINKAIQRSSCRTGLPLELPQSKISLINKIRFTIKEFEFENNSPPSLSELSEHLGISVDQIANLMPFVQSPISFNYKMQDDVNEKEFIDVFSAHYTDEPSEVEYSFIIRETRDEFHSILQDALSKKEIYILSSRRGLFGAPVKSVRTLASELNMSQQGIRQSEERSIVKLRKYLYSNDMALGDFI